MNKPNQARIHRDRRFMRSTLIILLTIWTATCGYTPLETSYKSVNCQGKALANEADRQVLAEGVNEFRVDTRGCYNGNFRLEIAEQRFVKIRVYGEKRIPNLSSQFLRFSQYAETPVDWIGFCPGEYMLEYGAGSNGGGYDAWNEIDQRYQPLDPESVSQLPDPLRNSMRLNLYAGALMNPGVYILNLQLSEWSKLNEPFYIEVDSALAPAGDPDCAYPLLQNCFESENYLCLGSQNE